MLKCMDVVVLEEAFKKNFEVTSENQVEGIPAQMKRTFMPNTNEKECSAKLAVVMEIGKKGTQTYPFEYRIKLEGIFSWEEELTKEEAEKMVMDEGEDFLYSFIRVYFYEAIRKADIAPIVLPRLKN